MNVTIIGIGHMARGIATRLLAGGNSVTLVGREPDKVQALVADLQPAVKGGATVRSVPESYAIQDEVVVLAVPYSAVTDVIRRFHGQLAQKIVVDITNTLNATNDDLVTPPGSSGAEEIAWILPAGASVVKAFNTTFAGPLVSGSAGGQPLDVFIAGDDAAAKQTVAELVTAGGMRPIDVGPLKRAQQLEGLGLLGITLQFTLNTGFQTAWKLLTP